MVEIKKGETYTASMTRKGNGSNGAWELLKVKNKRDTLNVWTVGGNSGVEEGDTFRVTEIETVKLSKKEYKGEWSPEVNINAKVEKVVSFSEVELDASEDPFNMSGGDGDLPF